MSLTIAPEAPPLTMDEHGCIRVGGTRVSLDVVIGDFKAGLQANEIADRYDVLKLADIHGAIAFYLRHKPEADAYLARRERETQELRAKIERDLKPGPSLTELRARWAARKGE